MQHLLIIILLVILFYRIRIKERYDNTVYDNNYLDTVKTNFTVLTEDEVVEKYISTSNITNSDLEVKDGGEINTMSVSELTFSDNNKITGNILVNNSLCFVSKNNDDRYCIKAGSGAGLEQSNSGEEEYTEGVYHMIKPVNHKIEDGSEITSHHMQNILRNSSQNIYLVNNGILEYENAGELKVTSVVTGGWQNEGWDVDNNKRALNIGSYTITGGGDKERVFVESIKLNPGYEVTGYYFTLYGLEPVWVFRNTTNDVQELTRTILSAKEDYDSFAYFSYKKDFDDTTIYKTTNSTYKYAPAINYITVKKTGIVKTD